ncbi:MAG: TetR/AcrR family transcriptional regulator [Candidatus Coproplasma sp.]
MANFTQKAIEASFWKLLNERPLSKITVKDIVDDCGINRNSFYYHFEDLPSLIKSMLKSSIDGLIASYPKFDSFQDCMNHTIRFFISNRRAFLHIYNSVNRDIFEQYLWDACKYCVSSYIDICITDKKINDSDKNIIISFYKCLLYGQMSAWFAIGMKDDITDEYNRFLELSSGIMDDMIQKSENKK